MRKRELPTQKLVSNTYGVCAICLSLLNERMFPRNYQPFFYLPLGRIATVELPLGKSVRVRVRVRVSVSVSGGFRFGPF